MQKKVLDEFYSKEEEEQPTQKQKKQQHKQPRGGSEIKEKVQSQKSMRAKRRQTETRLETLLSINTWAMRKHLYYESMIQNND